MTAEQFAYWMQGFAELSGDEPPTAAQWKSMREHLATVFSKVTPPLHAPLPVPGIPQAPWPQGPIVIGKAGGLVAARITC